MKKFLKIFVPVVLSLAIILCTGWYFLVYDREFTRDILLSFARKFEENGNMTVASQFYDWAYAQGSGNDAVAVELAQQYMDSGNYTQAEVTLNKAIKDGGGASVYVALSKTYVAQDKLLDAVNLLDKLPDQQLKAQLEAMRPGAPTVQQTPGFYNQYISVTVEATSGTLYVNPNGQYPSVKENKYAGPISMADGENTLYAICVGDDGLVSPLSVFGYTIGGVIQEVSFQDAAMEKAMREAILTMGDKPLLSNQLWDIKEFTVPKDANDYQDLKHLAFVESLTIEKGKSGQLAVLSGLTNLKTLHITNTVVSQDELAIIGSLPNLTKLTLSGCSLSTTAGLEKLTALQYLDLSKNAIRNISALSGMSLLSELYLQENALQDLSALSGCTLLTKANLSYNAITSLDTVAQLPVLSWLDVGHNKLSSLQNMGNLQKLEYFHADHNTVSDVSPLSGCQKLTDLNIANNKIEDISSLAKLLSLVYFDFSYNSVEKLPTWDKNSALVTIDGSYNKIKDLNGLKGLKSLNNVLMDYNEAISSVDVLADCPNLIRVNVFGTKVTNVKKLTDMSVVVNYNPLGNE